MKNTLRILALAFVSARAQAQSITVPDTLRFGTVSEKTAEINRAQTLQIHNAGIISLHVDSVRLFEAFGSGAGSLGRAYSTVVTNGFNIAAGANEGIAITMDNRHNVRYASTAIVCGTGVRGCKPVALKGDVVYSKGYYSTTRNLWGADLFQALKTKISANYQTFSYSQARDQMFMTVDNWRVNGRGSSQNKLVCIYSDSSAVGYTSRTDCQNNYQFNTEHTVPQSLFSSNTPMVSDLHHLFPTKNEPNNRRSNYPFDTVLSAISYQVNGSKLGTNNGTVFEPRDPQKGRTARAMCYFIVRHQDYQGFIGARETTIRRWAQHFSPDTVDLKRNADVQTYQGNRNPFVDYPQLLERLPSLASGGGTFPAISRAIAYPSFFSISSDDTAAIWYALVNQGNQPQAYTLPSAPAGFQLVGTASGTLPVGGAAAFRLVPQAPTQGLVTYTASTSTVQIQVNGPTATVTPTPMLKLTVRPNPATGQVLVSGASQVQVYSAIGRSIYTGQAGTLDVSYWPAGVYLVTGNGQHVRLIVE